jgi:hypothetical protein
LIGAPLVAIIVLVVTSVFTPIVVLSGTLGRTFACIPGLFLHDHRLLDHRYRLTRSATTVPGAVVRVTASGSLCHCYGDEHRRTHQ